MHCDDDGPCDEFGVLEKKSLTVLILLKWDWNKFSNDVSVPN